MSPVFYMFADREKVFSIIESITGARMHSSFFRIGGVAMDLPLGWDRLIREFIAFLPARLKHYDKMVMDNRILKQRTQGVGVYNTEQAIEWGGHRRWSQSHRSGMGLAQNQTLFRI